MKNKKEITEPYVGMRIKIVLPSSWCQIKTPKKVLWLKGKVTEVSSKNSISVKIWSRKYWWLKVDSMFCIRKNGVYPNIVKQM